MEYCDDCVWQFVCVCVFVCLRSCLRDYTSDLYQFFLCVLPMAVAQSSSSSGSVAIRYILLVLWMTSYLHISQGCSVSPPSWGAAHMQAWAWLETVRMNIHCRQQSCRTTLCSLGLLGHGGHVEYSMTSCVHIMSLRTQKCCVLKVTPQVATQGAESAICDCPVLSVLALCWFVDFRMAFVPKTWLGSASGHRLTILSGQMARELYFWQRYGLHMEWEHDRSLMWCMQDILVSLQYRMQCNIACIFFLHFVGLPFIFLSKNTPNHQQCTCSIQYCFGFCLLSRMCIFLLLGDNLCVIISHATDSNSIGIVFIFVCLFVFIFVCLQHQSW